MAQTDSGWLAAIDRARATSAQAAERCVAEGWRVIERALANGVELEAVAVARAAFDDPLGDLDRLLDALRQAAVPVVVAPDDWIAARTDGRTFGPILALARRPVASLERVVATPGPLLVLEQVRDPGNIGAIARSAAAFGAAGLCIIDGCDPFHGKALRTSMGALWRLPAVYVRGDPAGLQALARTAGRRNFAAALDGDVRIALDQPLPDGGELGPALWLGSEAHGLRPATAAGCDARVRIAMPGDDGGDSVDSLSVAAAAAVLLFAAQRAPPTPPVGAVSPRSA